MKTALLCLALLMGCLSAQAQFTKVNGLKGGTIREVLYENGALYARNQGFTYNQLFKSTDLGATWQDISTHFWVLGYESGATNLVKVGNKLFLSNASSTNDGATWATHPTIPFGMEQTCFSNGTIYGWQWVSGERKILRSLDTFNTYSTITAPTAPRDTNFNFKAMFVTSQGVAITTKGGIFHTADRGNTWQHIPLPLTPYELTQLGILKLSGTDIYYTLANVDSIRISQDMGLTWTGVYTRQSAVTDITRGAGNKYYAIVRSQPIMGVDLSVSHTLDPLTGNYFQMAGNSPIYNFTQKLTYVSPNTLIMPTEGMGVVKLDLATTTYSLINNGLACSGITVIGGNNNVTLAFKKNFSYERSLDRGNTWLVDTTLANVIHRDYNLPVTTLFNYNNKLYLGANSVGDRAYVTTDNAQSWKAINRGLDVLQGGVYPGIMGMTAHQNTVYACANNGYVYRLVNDTMWTATGRPSGNSVTSLASRGGSLFAATDQGPSIMGSIYKSADNGVTWTNSAGGVVFANVLSLAVSTDGTKLFAGDGSIGPHMSTDNGDTWQWINNGLTPQNGNFRVTMNAMQAYKSRIYAVQNFGFVRDSLYKLWYYDIPQGKWFCESCSQPNLNIVNYWVTDSVIYLGTDGDGVWKKKNNYQATGISLFEKENDDIRLYPNPSQSPTLAFAHFENYEGATMVVLNTLGQALQEEVVRMPKQQLRSMALPDGIYYIRVVKDGRTLGFSKWVKQ